jgi:hypothetical protein
MKVIIKYNFLKEKIDIEEYTNLSIDNVFEKLIFLYKSTKLPITAETDNFFMWIDNPSLQICVSQKVKDCNEIDDDC